MNTQHRRFLALGALAAATTLLAACSSSSTAAGDDESSASASADASDLTVTMVTPESTGEFYGAMYCGAQAAADEQGIDLTIQGTPETTVDAEMQVLQSVLATDPDGLLLTVWDNNAFNEVLSEYTDAGHPLVMPDSYLSDDTGYVQSIRTDSYESSYEAAEQSLTDFDITEGTVLVVTDAPGNAIQEARAEGFRDGIEENSDLTVLEFQYIGSDSAAASQAVSSAAAANPDLALVFSTNIGAGTGATNGISTSGSDDIVHVGYDTSSAQVEELRSGGYDALVAQSPYQMGYDATTLMAELLTGETTEDEVTEQTVYSPWMLVTADNVDDADTAAYLYTTDCSSIG
ncbi:MAG TPA: substrate-binding domain-containing protein [Cellulomonas sp.]